MVYFDKNYIRRLVIICSSIFLFARCDTPIEDFENPIIIPAEAIVSGTVMIDENDDNIGDIPAQNITVLCGAASNVEEVLNAGALVSNSNTFLSTSTDQRGAYEFVGLPPVQNWVVALLTNEYDIYQFDLTPDSISDGSGFNRNKIYISLEEDEHDKENNFILKLK